MVKSTQKRKPRTTNKATLDTNAQKSKDLSATATPEPTPGPQLDELPENIESTVQEAEDAANTEAADKLAAQVEAEAAEKPEDSPKRKIKATIVIAHTCPDQRCDFKTTSDEKKCPYDGNKLVLDEKLNH